MVENKSSLIDMLKSNGAWSRTQIAIVIQTMLALTLIILEVIYGNILTNTIMLAQVGLFVFAIVDRIDARHVDFKIGTIQATLKGKENEESSI